MNPARRRLAPVRMLHRLGMEGRRLLPRQRCNAFGDAADRIEQIYVINLDRQPERWHEM